MNNGTIDKEEVVKFFNAHAILWNSTLIKNDEIIKLIFDNAGIKENKDVLDVGSGTGVLIPYFLKRNVNKVVEIDIANQMIDVASRQYLDSKITYICEDAETYDFKEKYDSIIIYDSFPHFADQEGIIKHLASYLKEEGTLTIAHSMSQENINKCHKNVTDISLPLMNIDELSKMMSKYLDIKYTVSNDKIYQIVGKKKMYEE